MRSEQRAQAREALDRRLREISVNAMTPPPHGWARAIREALGMTTRQMARRVGVSAVSISSLERSERAGTVQLDTLRRAADALNCDLVYALVPRDSLEETVVRQARSIAEHEVLRVDRTMRLEDQADNRDHTAKVEQFTKRLVASGRVWESDVS
jgi:predicted DNA-binding mobile mystery protein A